jgi:hypothetical protein
MEEYEGVSGRGEEANANDVRVNRGRKKVPCEGDAKKAPGGEEAEAAKEALRMACEAPLDGRIVDSRNAGGP